MSDKDQTMVRADKLLKALRKTTQNIDWCLADTADSDITLSAKIYHNNQTYREYYRLSDWTSKDLSPPALKAMAGNISMIVVEKLVFKLFNVDLSCF